MTAKAFVDTNVLVYAFDTAHPVRRARAAELLEQLAGSFALSTQVLGEFYVTVTRKLASPLSHEEAAEAVAALVPRTTISIEPALVQAAIRTSVATQISYWDALIVEAAASAGCERVLTEDLNDGQVIAGVRIENPFAGPVHGGDHVA
jgi:predicted nucleic acid-binding protein